MLFDLHTTYLLQFTVKHVSIFNGSNVRDSTLCALTGTRELAAGGPYEFVDDNRGVSPKS